MKVIDKISLVLFSIIVFVLSIAMCLIVFGWVDLNSIYLIIKDGLENNIVANSILGCSIVFMLLAVKAIFFYSTDAMEDGLKLKNESGNLLISKETIQNLVNNVVTGFENTENVTTKIGLDKQNNLQIDVILYVLPNTIIKELSANLQTRIKEVIKNTTDLDVTSVNIKVKNVTTKKESIQE